MRSHGRISVRPRRGRQRQEADPIRQHARRRGRPSTTRQPPAPTPGKPPRAAKASTYSSTSGNPTGRCKPRRDARFDSRRFSGDATLYGACSAKDPIVRLGDASAIQALACRNRARSSDEIEQRISNPCVPGSNPGGRNFSVYLKTLRPDETGSKGMHRPRRIRRSI
jgi:hypothetical protein